MKSMIEKDLLWERSIPCLSPESSCFLAEDKSCLLMNESREQSIGRQQYWINANISEQRLSFLVGIIKLIKEKRIPDTLSEHHVLQSSLYKGKSNETTRGWIFFHLKEHQILHNNMAAELLIRSNRFHLWWIGRRPRNSFIRVLFSASPKANLLVYQEKCRFAGFETPACTVSLSANRGPGEGQGYPFDEHFVFVTGITLGANDIPDVSDRRPF